MSSYKDIHEQFVSNHSGTNLAEISQQLGVSVAAVLLRDGLLLMFGLYHIRINLMLKFLLDFVCLFIPLLLVATLLNEVIALFLISVISVGLSLLIWQIISKSNPNKKLQNILYAKMSGKRPFIEYFRAFVNIGTAVVILAVDFKVFPRRFAKTETYGSGFMDVGVGCFVVANAIVSPEARNQQKYVSSVNDKTKIILHSIKSCLPLIVLGIIRVMVVKGIDYHEHVSEYGVHWNFFLTLAVIKIISTILLTIVPIFYSSILSLVIIFIYQYLLSAKGLSNYILHGSDGHGTRNSFIDANREGIYSCCGYVTLYLVGVQLGRYIFRKRERLIDWLRLLVYIVLIFIVSNVLLMWTSSYIEPISRRLCNASYILWMISETYLLLGGFLLADILITVLTYVCTEKSESIDLYQSTCLLRSVNYNSLGFFMLSNVLTGLVNVFVQTVYMDIIWSMIILVVYLLLLAVISMGLYHNQVKIKFW